MILISHRGNISGRNPEKENKIFYIEEALHLGYSVEIDVRSSNGKLFLGHDCCQEEIDLNFLLNIKLWVHVKNIEAAEIIRKFNKFHQGKIHWFWHQEDDITLTSMNFVWTYPGKQLIEGGIAVMPELNKDWDITLAGGICTDYPLEYSTTEH